MRVFRKELYLLLNGILFVALFALLSTYLAGTAWMSAAKINSLVIAIILGIIFSNTLRHRLPSEWTPGIHFSAKQLLRLAIILYGFRISFQEIVSVGLKGLVLDILIISFTLFLGTFIGEKIFKLDRHLALLISAGSAICGAAAVLAVEDVLKSESYKTTVAVGTVVLFGTIAMFLYPLLQHMNLFQFNDSLFGILAGASIHEVAQAVVAANDISPHAANIAVIVKMTRVLLLVPVLLFLSFYENRLLAAHQSKTKKNPIPLFAIFFVVVIIINSLHFFSHSIVQMINSIDIFLLTMAMAAIGMETNLSKLKMVGLKPIYFASLLFIGLMIQGYCLIKLIYL